MCVLTPTDTSDLNQVARLEWFWQSIGMQTVHMSPSSSRSLSGDDQPLTAFSRFRIGLNALRRKSTIHRQRLSRYNATRAGDPNLWTHILLNNVDSILMGIDQLQQRSASFRDAMKTRDTEQIRMLLAEGQKVRISLDKTEKGMD